MSLAQFSAYHLREIIYNLDMLAIARSTKLTATSKEIVEDETSDIENLSNEDSSEISDVEKKDILKAVRDLENKILKVKSLVVK